MGYNKKRIRGIHRIYSDDIDWKVTIGDNKRFVIDTVAYGMEITEDDINTAAQYCAENEFPFGFITNGDDIVIVSGCKDDEQPILRSLKILRMLLRYWRCTIISLMTPQK